MQERARAEVINILGDKPITPTSEQLKVSINHDVHTSNLIIALT